MKNLCQHFQLVIDAPFLVIQGRGLHPIAVILSARLTAAVDEKYFEKQRQTNDS
jgi:hypothetical protein